MFIYLLNFTFLNNIDLMLLLVFKHKSLLLIIIDRIIYTLILLNDLFVIKVNKLLFSLVEFMLLLFIELPLVESQLLVSHL